MIIEGSIAAANTLQLIVKIYHDFSQWHEELNLHTISGNEILSNQFATLTQTECHDRADIVCRSDNRSIDIWFFHMLNERWVRHSRWVMHLHRFAMLVIYHVRHVWHGSNHIHIEFSVESLLHNLHVEQSEESATETETEGCRTLMLERERSIIQLQLFQ